MQQGLANGSSGPAGPASSTLEQLSEFLRSVVTTPAGYFELGVRNGNWQQHWYEWPTDVDRIAEHALQAGATEGTDVYFSAYLFETRDSKKSNVLEGGRTIQADLDHADTSNLSLAPTILVQTSPGRHQGYWVVEQDFDSLEAQEQLSKKLTYSIPLCDRSGWSLGHKVRVPYTQNYKYKAGPYPVLIEKQTTRLYSIDELELLPSVEETAGAGLAGSGTSGLPNGTWIEHPPQTNSKGAHEIVESIKDQLSAKVYSEYLQDGPTQDRSASLFQLELQCFRAGLPREDVYWVAYHSPNNKFKADLRYNHERELAKHVLVAEAAVKNTQTNLRDIINDIRRKTKTLQAERRYVIAEIVKGAMQKDGDFIHAVDGRRYYVPRDSGKPIEIEMNSEPLHSLLDVKYSLNRTEVEHTYCVSNIVAYSGTLPETTEVSVLSHYDQASKQVLLHGGRKDVYVASHSPAGLTSTQVVPNGTYSRLFPWDRIIEPFVPSYDPEIDWAAILFNLPNVLNMSPEETRCVLKVWVLFSLLRDAATSRPILAFLGQPGSGKTSTARKLYAFFYGRHMDVSGATSPVHYDMATANLPFYVLDNLDTWEKWIPDRLAQSAGKSDVIVRKLYTNDQIIRIKRQAMIAVTAHDPKFGRADVTDRMLIINLQRFSNVGIPFEDEGQLINQVIQNRNKLWGSVLHDLQLILNTPMPETTELQLRIQDFARLGEWIAIALGEADMFRAAVHTLQAAQRSFNLDEDHILVTSLLRWIHKRTSTKPRTQDELFSEVLSLVPGEDIKTFNLLYKNSTTFTKRISNLQDTLSNTLFEIDSAWDAQGQRLWEINER